MKRLQCLIVASLAALVLATAGSAASPQHISSLGYATIGSTFQGCTWWSFSGFGVSVNLGSDCAEGFQAKVDEFYASHPERKLGFQHPDAVQARAALELKGYTVGTSFSPFPLFEASFWVTGGCADGRVAPDPASLVAFSASLPSAEEACAPPTTPPPPAGEPPAPAPVAPAIQSQLDDLAGRVSALEQALVASLDAHVAALAAGKAPWEAALAARSAGMNALYGLPSDL